MACAGGGIRAEIVSIDGYQSLYTPPVSYQPRPFSDPCPRKPYNRFWNGNSAELPRESVVLAVVGVLGMAGGSTIGRATIRSGLRPRLIRRMRSIRASSRGMSRRSPPGCWSQVEVFLGIRARRRSFAGHSRTVQQSAPASAGRWGWPFPWGHVEDRCLSVRYRSAATRAQQTTFVCLRCER